MTAQIALATGSFILTLIAAMALSITLVRYASSGGPVYLERDRRALGLLKEWLTPEQLTCYERFRYFEVIGSDTGTRFRIHHGTQTNVEELGSGDRLVCKWCFGPDGNLAPGDVMLAQKIALETNERGALAVANRSYFRPAGGLSKSCLGCVLMNRAWCGLIDVRYARIATKFRIAAK